jgi:hypothetical protein
VTIDPKRFLVLAVAPAILLAASSCDTADATHAVVANAYPAVLADASADASAVDETFVVRAWWSVALFPDAVAAGTESGAARVVPATEYAYALLARGWDPTSAATPGALVAVRTTERLSAARGRTLRIVLGPGTVVGDCAAGTPLSQDEADFVTTRIFPGAFAGLVYDAATCVATAPPLDAGVTAGEDGGVEARVEGGVEGDGGAD